MSRLSQAWYIVDIDWLNKHGVLIAQFPGHQQTRRSVHAVVQSLVHSLSFMMSSLDGVSIVVVFFTIPYNVDSESSDAHALPFWSALDCTYASGWLREWMAAIE